MRSLTVVCALIIISSIAIAAGQANQSSQQKTAPTKKAAQPETAPQVANPAENQQEKDGVKLSATLVSVPVIASDRNGLYITDMRKDDFTIYEDGVKQEAVFFATVKEPFSVVLMLDTSASTQDQLRQIKKAARAFIEQLQPADRVKVIAFADEVRDLIEFTNDQAALRNAIEGVEAGKGTKLYDAVRLGLSALRPVEGRKAMVIFTDGVDWHSDSASYEGNIREIEESGVIAYPIRYNTRATTEAIMRQQRGPADPTVIGGPPTGTTPTTVPGDTRVPGPRTGGLSLPEVILGRKDPRIPGTRGPDINLPRERYPDSRYPNDPRYPDNRPAGDRYPNEPGTRRRPDRMPDSTDMTLDNLYRQADNYLNELARASGGKLHRADSLVSLPLAFEQIAAELRTQYSIGYYPTNTARDGNYRKIEVRTNRKDVVVRARPGYRASNGA
jgi:Mg-chelatase subunit ChlD